VARPQPEPLTEHQLHRWRLVEDFRQRLDQAARSVGLAAPFSDPARLLDLASYLSLFLFGLLNPVVRTMRGLCAASDLERVQQEICRRHVSLGSFSEAQGLLDPLLLERVFSELASQVGAATAQGAARRTWEWMARDGSVFRALPRMHWALSGSGRGGDSHAVKLHLNLHLLEDKPVRAQMRPAKQCERAVWREQWQAGDAYVGDRYFGENYQVLGQLMDRGCAFVIRLKEQAVITVEEELPVSPTDRLAGVVRQAWVRLGAQVARRSRRVRVVWVEAEGHALLLVTNLEPEALPAGEVALLYRQRWQVELFFRWIKCILGCRHWLAESPAGVTIQLYLALIAALLLQLYTGQRPTRRMMELIQFYLVGMIGLEELWAGLERERNRGQNSKKRA
jgi:hypothetical protein